MTELTLNAVFSDDPWAYHDWRQTAPSNTGTANGSWSVYDLVEPFVRGGSSFLAGLYSSSAGFFQVLDCWTRVVEAKTGLKRGGLFEEVAKGQQEWAAYFAARGLDPQAGGAVALAHYLYSALGKTSFDIPTICAMGLPAYSATYGGAEAARNGGSAAEGAARGLALGLLLHGIMRALNYLPRPERCTISGLMFCGASLLEELKKPAGARNFEKVIADFVLGAGLAATGGPGRRRQELMRDLHAAYAPQIRRAAGELKLAVERAHGSSQSRQQPSRNGGGDAINVAGVSASVKKIELKLDDPAATKELAREHGNFSYEVSFGKISRSQFQRLMDYFRKAEPLSYDKNTSYDLTDFLPAKMQALLNKRLDVRTRSSKALSEVDLFYKNEGIIYSTINCWGTVWELIRDPSARTPFVTFLSSRRYAQKLLESDAYSVAIAPGNARFLDPIFFYSESHGVRRLEHGANFVFKDFFFERTDSSSESFFRLVRFDDMSARLKSTFGNSGVDGSRTVSHAMRRFGDTTPLPDPITAFSAAHASDKPNQEYVDALPRSVKRDRVTLFADGKMGGGDEVHVVDIQPFNVRINPITGRGELEQTREAVRRFHP